jgi:1-phosphofructokinase family hexose kinase
MIRSICFNPVIDRQYFINDFSAAKKFKEIPPQVYIGGKGINIARVAAQMDEPCVLYGFIGGKGGKMIREEIERMGIDFKYGEINGETRTTINIIDNKNHRETEITETSIPVTPDQELSILNTLKKDIVAGDIVICSGIPIAGMRKGIYKTISNWCLEKDAKCVLDTNGRYLFESFPGDYIFMKPNLSELSELHNKAEITGTVEIIKLAKKTLGLGIANLLISTGRGGGIFFNSDVALRITVPDKPVKSTIGSGDSTVAGFCVAFQRGYPMEDCLKLAMACGVCNAMLSQVGCIEKELVTELVKEINLYHL